MHNELTEVTGDTVRLLRPPPRVFSETRDRNVWIGGIGAIDFELDLEPGAEKHNPYNSA